MTLFVGWNTVHLGTRDVCVHPSLAFGALVPALRSHSLAASGWKGTPGFSKGESWIPAGTRGTLGSRSCRSVPLESDVNFQLKQSNRGFSFSASHLIWILASPPGIAGFRAGRPAARNPAEVVTSVLLGTHEHTRKTNCMEKSLLSLNCMTVHDLCRPSPAL